jgi:hypothetical protein
LHGARADNVSEGRLRTFYQRLAKVRDAKCGAVRVRDLEIYHRVAGWFIGWNIRSVNAPNSFEKKGFKKKMGRVVEGEKRSEE